MPRKFWSLARRKSVRKMSKSIDEQAYENTDVELWREPTLEVGMDYYQPSIHRTQDNKIGIDVGGHVFVKTLEEWHNLAKGTAQAEKEARIDEIERGLRQSYYPEPGKTRVKRRLAQLRGEDE